MVKGTDVERWKIAKAWLLVCSGLDVLCQSLDLVIGIIERIPVSGSQIARFVSPLARSGGTDFLFALGL